MVTTDRSKAMVLIMFILCVDLRLLVVGLFLFFCMFCHVLLPYCCVWLILTGTVITSFRKKEQVALFFIGL